MSAAEKITPTTEDSFEAFRTMAHDKLDEVLEKLRPLFSKENKPDLKEISEALQEFKQDFSGILLQEAARGLHREEEQAPQPCPQCGKLVGKAAGHLPGDRDQTRKKPAHQGLLLLPALSPRLQPSGR